MRKHFLILMLLTLLPLAGWADDVTVTPREFTKTYGNPDEVSVNMFTCSPGVTSEEKALIAEQLQIVRVQAGEDVTNDGYLYRLVKTGNTASSTIFCDGQSRIYIQQRPLDAAKITLTLVNKQYYDGTAKTPQAGNITLSYTGLIAGTSLATSDWDIDADGYSDNTERGTAHLTINGKGNFSGSAVLDFEILGTNIANGATAEYKGAALTWNNTPKTPAANAFEVKYKGTKLTAGTHYQIKDDSYTANNHAGTAHVTIEGIDSYAGEIDATFDIAPAAALPTGAAIAITNPVYNAQAATPTVVITDAANNNYELLATDFEAVSEDVDAGDATLTIRALPGGNYEGAADVTKAFTITRKNFASANVKASYTKKNTYNGEEIMPTVTIVDKDLDNKALVEGFDYTITYKDMDDTSDEEDLVNAGTKKIVLTGKGNYRYSKDTDNTQYEIEAAPLTFAVGDKTVGIGAEDYAPTVIISGFVASEATAQEAALRAAMTLKYTDNSTSTETATPTAAMGTYTVEPVIAVGAGDNQYNNANYAWTIAAGAKITTGTLTVTKGTVTAKVAEAEVTFGTDFSAIGDGVDEVHIVHVNGLNPTKAADFNTNVGYTNITGYKVYEDAACTKEATKYVYTDPDDIETEQTFYPAGTYYVKATGTATYTDYDVILTPGVWTVNPKKITEDDIVAAGGYTRKYTGTTAVPSTAGKLTFSGMTLKEGVDYDVAIKNPTSGDGWDNLTVAKGGKITITAKGNYTNNNVVVEREFAITQANLVITPTAATWTYGQAEPTYHATISTDADKCLVGADADKKADIEDGKTVAGFGTLVVNRVCDATLGVFENGLKANGIANANYNVSLNYGQLTISKMALVLKVKDVQLVYGQAFANEGLEVDPSTPDYDKLDALVISNIMDYVDGEETPGYWTLQDAYDDDDNKYVVGEEYTITAKKATAEEAGITSTNFDITEIKTGKFTLTQRPITLTTLNQTVNLAAGGKFEAAAYVDGINVSLQHPATVSLSATDATSGLDDDDDLDDLGITLAYTSFKVGSDNLITVTMTNPNYQPTYNNVGVLTVTGAPTVYFTSADTDADQITTYATSGTPVNVMMNFAPRSGQDLKGARNWDAEKWNTLVLPFDITVADLSKVLGYAVVNVIDATGAKYNAGDPIFKFKLTMKGGNDDENGNQVLKANRPFVVKTTDAIKLKNNDDSNYYYNFGPQTIVAPTAADAVNAGLGCTFEGTYKTKLVDKNSNGLIRFLTGNYDSWISLGSSSSLSWNVVPFAAFIDMKGLTPEEAARATFIMEEADGSTTAIRGISADEINSKNVEGMYNLNGMKLNTVPTQKGVYIQNGKKLVVK